MIGTLFSASVEMRAFKRFCEKVKRHLFTAQSHFTCLAAVIKLSVAKRHTFNCGTFNVRMALFIVEITLTCFVYCVRIVVRKFDIRI